MLLISRPNLSGTAYILPFHTNSLYTYNPDLLTYISAQTSDKPITVLAPSNAAFAKTVYYSIIGPAFSDKDVPLIKSILDYHVVDGNHPSTNLLPTFQYFETHLTNSSYCNVTGGQRVGGVMQSGTIMIWTSGQSNRSPVIEMDIEFAGGTIHIIDSLLIPPSSFPATAELFSNAAEPFEITSFLGATYYDPSNTTGTVPALAKLLNETSDITIFAPNNAAMSKVADALAGYANGDLASFEEILEYHIISGQGGPYYSTLWNTSSSSLKTLNGGNVTISFASNSFFVNGARILTPDLLLANGIMHVLDNVLSPDAATQVPDPQLATQMPALETGSRFNVSSAPYTTWLPNTVNTEKAVQTAATYSAGNGANGGKSTTTGSGSARQTGSGKSGAGRVRGGLERSERREGFLFWGSVVGAMVVGAGMALV